VCVPRRTTAVVSYRPVRLASGSVLGFCGQNENVTEVGNVMAWGTVVPVPRFARNSLADELGRREADVDVKLMPREVLRHLLPIGDRVQGPIFLNNIFYD
jgi:hypothetical protein